MDLTVAPYPSISPIPGGHATGCQVCGLTVSGLSVGQTATAYGTHVANEHAVASTAARERDRLRDAARRSAVAVRAITVLEVIAQEAGAEVRDVWGTVSASRWPDDRVAEWAARTAAECVAREDAEVRSALGRVEAAARLAMRML